MKNLDVVLLSAPKMDLRAPSIGLGMLKAICNKAGKSSLAIDLNILLWRHYVAIGKGYLWSYDDDTLIDSNLFKNIEKSFEDIVEVLLKDRFKDKVPEFIGLSIFSIFNFVTSRSILKVARRNFPSAKIVIGGPGISFRNKKEVLEIVEQFKSEGICDDFIFGESERSFYLYLCGTKLAPGINNFDLDIVGRSVSSLIPDYSDFDFSDYPKKHTEPRVDSQGPNKWIYITGSKGCVRDCTFCDVNEIWPKYTFKSGIQLAEEMYIQYQKFGVDKFRFTDSLLNGNTKELLAMSRSIIDKKMKIIWHGQFICRDSKQHPPEHYDILREAGLDLVSVGIESGSQKIRFDMRKNFSDEALYYTLEQLDRVGIKLVPLMLVGYPTELEDDFKMTLNFLDRLTAYSNIVDVNLNNPMRVLPGSPVGDNAQEFGILIKRSETNHDFTALWEYKENTYKVRIERFFRFHNQLLKSNLRRSYAGNDLNFYYNEYLSLDVSPNSSIVAMMESVIKGTHYDIESIL